jgi:SPP1 family predicted phage head-tail adaptor
MLRAGKLRQRVTIQQKGTTADAAGQISDSWSTLITVSGAVMDMGGRETILGEQVDATVDAVVIIRKPRTSGNLPTPEMRVQFTDDLVTRTLNISSVLNKDDMHKELWLMCREDA